ncbi:hypothetical protein EET67_00535 [Pseudaminobacter arsenicus]|uniref:Uncharacterized protein n=1 Tax=Borborobacter arsenicus TaxID=1851146 RepID=A0A432VBD9_9HYPH|nr:hypothetical protein [Pseudaminobacter arsenicus]RUM99436.1 hypothetical protein EET67_00535 [Pseudaminobacter arsenicus]
MKIKAACAMVALTFALAACATPPKQVSFKNSETYNLGKDETWERLLSYFTSNHVQIKTIEKDSGVIYAERSTIDASMADCGEAPLMAEIARTGTLNVFVRPKGGQTEVTVNSEFKVIRMFDNQTFTVACFSTGVLETSILASIR